MRRTSSSTRVELELVPDPVDEGDVDRLAVEVAGEIEQEHFEQHGADVEHRPAAEARDPVVAAPADADAHRVDAVAQPAGRIEPQVGGRIAELAPALVAVHDLAADEPGIAERALAASSTWPAASASRIAPEEMRRPSSSTAGTMSTAKCRRAPSAASRSGVPARFLPKRKSIADGGARDAEPMQQDVVDEVLGRGLRQRGVEGQHDRAVEPGAGEQAQLGALVGQAEQRLLRPEEAARMRLEGQRRSRPAECTRAR